MDGAAGVCVEPRELAGRVEAGELAIPALELRLGPARGLPRRGAGHLAGDQHRALSPEAVELLGGLDLRDVGQAHDCRVVTGLAVLEPELDLPLLFDEPAELVFTAWLLLVECAARAGSCPETSCPKIPIHTATNTAVPPAMNRLRSFAIRARRAARRAAGVSLVGVSALPKHRRRSLEKRGGEGRYL